MHPHRDRSAVPSFGRAARARVLRFATILLAAASVVAGECDPKGPGFFAPIGEAIPDLGDIFGQVTVDGEGRSGVMVTVRRGDEEVGTVTTGEDGQYEFINLEPGTYTVSISTVPDAQCPGPQTAMVRANDRTRVDFPCTSLPTTGTVTGSVVDGEGVGIAGAQVALDGRTATTASDGSFSFEEVSPGTHTVGATIDGFQCTAQTTTVTAGQTSNVEIPCLRTVPTGAQIAGGYRLDGVGRENTCATGNPFPNPGETVTNPGPIEVGSEQSDGQTFVTIVSNTRMRGALNTMTGEWTGMGTEPISSNLDLWETTTGGRWQFDDSRNVFYGTSDAELQFRIVDNMGTSDPADDVEVCRAIVEDVRYTRLGDFVPSSARFKRDVRSLLPEGTTVLGLRPVAFRYRQPWGDPGVLRLGLIAEEVAPIFPNAVALDGGGEPFGIRYGTLGRLLVEEVGTRAGAAVAAAVSRLAGASGGG